MPIAIAEYYSWRYETRQAFADDRLYELIEDNTIMDIGRDITNYDMFDKSGYNFFERNVLTKDLDWHSKTYNELKNMVWRYFKVDKKPNNINVAEATLSDLLEKGVLHWQEQIKKRERKKRKLKKKKAQLWRL